MPPHDGGPVLTKICPKHHSLWSARLSANIKSAVGRMTPLADVTSGVMRLAPLVIVFLALVGVAPSVKPQLVVGPPSPLKEA